MDNFFGSFNHFLFIQNFFKTRKIYLIFFLYLIGTLMEMINIGLIIPFLNLMFNETPINIFPFNFNFELFKFENNFFGLNIKY